MTILESVAASVRSALGTAPALEDLGPAPGAMLLRQEPTQGETQYLAGTARRTCLFSLYIRQGFGQEEARQRWLQTLENLQHPLPELGPKRRALSLTVTARALPLELEQGGLQADRLTLRLEYFTHPA